MRATRASRAQTQTQQTPDNNSAASASASASVPADRKRVGASSSPPAAPKQADVDALSDAAAASASSAAAAAAAASPAPSPSATSPTPTASPPPESGSSASASAAAAGVTVPPPDTDAVVDASGSFGAETKYERLHHLLDQTSLFAKFLSERMPSRYAAASKQAAVSSTGPKASQLAERAAALKQLIPDASLELQPFQVQGIDWLISLYENGLNGILADEMGLGKTIQVVMFLAHLRRHKVYGPFLIVAPLGTLPAWKNELARWTPEVPLLLYHGTKQERATMRAQFASASSPDATFPVVITNYETAMNDATHLKRVHWKMLVVDEGHRLKNLECALLQKLKSFHSENRLLLTGTPLQNNLLELWSLLHFLLPDIFSSLSQFQSWFDFDERSLEQREGQEYVISAERDNLLVSKLHSILRPFVLRRVKADVLKQLAQKKEYLVYTPLTQMQRMYYQSILDGELRSLSARQSMNNVLMQLRKVCQHPYLLISDQEEIDRGLDMEAVAAQHEQNLAATSQRVLQLLHAKPSSAGGDAAAAAAAAAGDDMDTDAEASDGEWETVPQRNKRRKRDAATAAAAAASERQVRARNNSSSAAAAAASSSSFPAERLASVCGKLRFLDQLFPALQARGSRVLVFSQMTRVMDVLEDYLSLRGISKYCRIDGTTKSDERQQAIDTFNNDPSYFCFLLSTRAGGLGINLASADTVVLFDSDWNPTVDAQAADRAHRLTQQRTVLVFRLLSPGTVEMAMHARASSKKTLEQIVLTKGKFHAHAGAGAAHAPASRNEEAQAEDADGAVVVPDWRRQSSIVHELVELFSGGSRTKLPVQMNFADASPAAAAQHAQAAATSAAAAASPPPRAQRISSLKRKSSSRSSTAAAAAAASSTVAGAPPAFDPALLSRLLERDREPPADVLPATPFDSGFELVQAAERTVMDILVDRNIPTAADLQA